MSLELLYTSAPAGLKRGSRGFATVLCTEGTPSNIATRLETLSGYRHVFTPQDSQASQNPVNWSHLRFSIGGRPTSILSRIAGYGVDYSGRTNKLAHHVVLEPGETAAAGPAWLLARPSLMRTTWDNVCETPPAGPAIAAADQPPAVCQHWQSVAGDAGWGGVVAEAIASGTGKPLWIIFSIQQSDGLLSLINEAIALLPVSQRWQATFSTYYTNLPPEIDCKLRCVLAGTEEAKLAAARGSVIDLTKALGPAPASTLTNVARTGTANASLEPLLSPTTTQQVFDPVIPSHGSVVQGRGDIWTGALRKESADGPRNPTNGPSKTPPRLPTAVTKQKKPKSSKIIAVTAFSVVLLLVIATAGNTAIRMVKQHANSIATSASPTASVPQSTQSNKHRTINPNPDIETPSQGQPKATIDQAEASESIVTSSTGQLNESEAEAKPLIPQSEMQEKPTNVVEEPNRPQNIDDQTEAPPESATEKPATNKNEASSSPGQPKDPGDTADATEPSDPHIDASAQSGATSHPASGPNEALIAKININKSFESNKIIASIEFGPEDHRGADSYSWKPNPRIGFAREVKKQALQFSRSSPGGTEYKGGPANRDIATIKLIYDSKAHLDIEVRPGSPFRGELVFSNLDTKFIDEGMGKFATQFLEMTRKTRQLSEFVKTEGGPQRIGIQIAMPKALHEYITSEAKDRDAILKFTNDTNTKIESNSKIESNKRNATDDSELESLRKNRDYAEGLLQKMKAIAPHLHALKEGVEVDMGELLLYPISSDSSSAPGGVLQRPKAFPPLPLKFRLKLVVE